MKLKLVNKILGYCWAMIIVIQYIYNHFVIDGPGIVENLAVGFSIFVGLLFLLLIWYQEKRGYSKEIFIAESLLLLGSLGFVINMLLASKNSY